MGEISTYMVYCSGCFPPSWQGEVGTLDYCSSTLLHYLMILFASVSTGIYYEESGKVGFFVLVAVI